MSRSHIATTLPSYTPAYSNPALSRPAAPREDQPRHLRPATSANSTASTTTATTITTTTSTSASASASASASPSARARWRRRQPPQPQTHSHHHHHHHPQYDHSRRPDPKLPSRPPLIQDSASVHHSTHPSNQPPCHRIPHHHQQQQPHQQHYPQPAHLGPPPVTTFNQNTTTRYPPPSHHQIPQTYHHHHHHQQPCSHTSPASSGELPDPPFVGSMTKDKFVHAVATSLDKSAMENRNRFSLPTYSEPESVFFSVSRPEISTRDYVKRLVTYTQCSPAAFVVMMIYIDRIANANQKLRVTFYNMHRLLVTALTLACKMLDDRCFSNFHYAKVGGIPTAREMNRLELQFLSYVNYTLHVDCEEFDNKHRSLERQPLPTSPVSLFELDTALSSSSHDKDDVQSTVSSAEPGASVSASVRSDYQGKTDYSHPQYSFSTRADNRLQSMDSLQSINSRELQFLKTYDPQLSHERPVGHTRQQMQRRNGLVP